MHGISNLMLTVIANNEEHSYMGNACNVCRRIGFINGVVCGIMYFKIFIE